MANMSFFLVFYQILLSQLIEPAVNGFIESLKMSTVNAQMARVPPLFASFDAYTMWPKDVHEIKNDGRKRGGKNADRGSKL